MAEDVLRMLEQDSLGRELVRKKQQRDEDVAIKEQVVAAHRTPSSQPAARHAAAPPLPHPRRVCPSHG